MSDFIFFKPVSLAAKADFDEELLKKAVIDNPECLGLGDVRVIDRERTQKEGGRLDLLLESDDDVRFEVEVQLGKTDPSHIIRTIEYWDNERRQYPSYDHVAVIIAENLTARFWNVINILNQSIPLIAIQVSAFKTPEGKTGFVFSKLLDRRQLNVENEETMIDAKSSCREDWQIKNPQALAIADEILSLVENSNVKLSFLQGYIGFKVNNRSVNFASIEPRKKFSLVKIFAPHEEIKDLLNHLELADIRYQDNCLRIRLDLEYLKNNAVIIKKILFEAWKIRCSDLAYGDSIK